VVTLGTPFRTNYTPKDVRMVVATSNGDKIDQLANCARYVPGEGNISEIPSNFGEYPNAEHIAINDPDDPSSDATTHGVYMGDPYVYHSIIDQANGSGTGTYNDTVHRQSASNGSWSYTA
jgi:hypothetical protein